MYFVKYNVNMDATAYNGMIYGIVAIIVAGGFLYMTRTTSIFSPLGTAAYSTASLVGRTLPTLTTFQRWGRIAGILIPFVLMATGPLMDLYYNNFRYTTITLVGISSILLGFAYQTFIRGTTAYLSSLTIGTSAILSYVLYDVWTQGETYNYKVLSTLLGVILMLLQLVHTTASPVFTTSLMNDLVGTLLGSGLGVIAWTVVWNHYRNCLPNSVAVKSEK